MKIGLFSVGNRYFRLASIRAKKGGGQTEVISASYVWFCADFLRLGASFFAASPSHFSEASRTALLRHWLSLTYNDAVPKGTSAERHL